MSRATRFSIAASLSFILVVGAFILLINLSDEPDEIAVVGDRIETPEPAPEVTPEPQPEPAPVVVQPNAETPAPETMGDDGIPLAPKPELIRGRWLLTGRVVKRAGASETLVPAAEVKVYFKPHPRRTPEDAAPDPQKYITGRDGRFALVGIPGEMWLRMEVDAEGQAYRTISFKLNDPEWKGHKDLGDIIVEPARTLAIQIQGPNAEPVLGAEVLVGRRKDERSVSLEDAGMKESRRGAVEKGDGRYVLERAARGLVRIQVRAPGYQRFREYVDPPETGPVVITLKPGLSITGVVESLEGEPISGAELEIDGPNIGSPLPVVTTGADGEFGFHTLSDGEYDITVNAEGYVSTEHKNVTAGIEAVTFALARESIYAGVVLTDGDGPLPDTEVRLQNEVTGDRYTDTTASDGTFRVRGIGEGFYEVAVKPERYVRLEIENVEIGAESEVTGQTLRVGKGIAITGTVKESTTERPIRRALVRLRSRSEASGGPAVRVDRKTETDHEGRFTVSGLPEGAYRLYAKAEGYLQQSTQTITIASGESTEFEVTLDPGGRITGLVADSAGDPVVAATVELRRLPQPRTRSVRGPDGQRISMPVLSGSSSKITTALTDTNGRYELVGIPNGDRYQVIVEHRDFTDAKSDVLKIENAETIEGIDLTLTRGGSIAGRVVDETGQPVADARVSAIPASANPQNAPIDPNLAKTDPQGLIQMLASQKKSSSPTVRVEADGSFVIPRLVEGTYSVSARADGRLTTQVDDIQVAGEATAEGVEIVLERGEVLAGIVVDASGHLIVGAEVRAGSSSSTRDTTDLNGQFRIEGLQPGEQNVRASKSGFVTRSQKFTAPDEQIEILLEVEASIVGVVVDRATGEPVDDVRLRLRPPASAQQQNPAPGGLPGGVQISNPNSGMSFPSTKTRPDGSFTLKGIWPGDFQISASHAKYAPLMVSVPGITAGEVRELTIEIDAGSSIAGVVTGAGAPLPDARVSVYLRSRQNGAPSTSKSVRTGPDGSYVVEGLPPGEYSFSVNPPSAMRAFIAHNEQVNVPQSQAVAMSVDLQPAVHVFGLVVSGGQPVPSGRINAWNPQGGGSNSSDRVDGSGRYDLYLQGGGTYAYQIRSLPNGGRATGELKVPEGVSEFEFNIDLPSGSIIGTIVDAETGQPVARAVVSGSGAQKSLNTLQGFVGVMQSSSRSDDAGQFALTHLSPGTYTVRVAAPDFAPKTVEGIVVPESGSANALRIELERGGAIQARVVDSRGAPVQGAFALLRDETGNFVQVSRPSSSDENGEMLINGITPGSYSVQVMHQGYAPGNFDVALEKGTVEAVFRLESGGGMRVTIVDSRGDPIPGATLELTDGKRNVLGDMMMFNSFNGRGARGRISDATGAILVERIPAGSYEVVAVSGNARSRPERIRIESNKTIEKRIVLR